MHDVETLVRRLERRSAESPEVARYLALAEHLAESNIRREEMIGAERARVCREAISHAPANMRDKLAIISNLSLHDASAAAATTKR